MKRDQQFAVIGGKYFILFYFFETVGLFLMEVNFCGES